MTLPSKFRINVAVGLPIPCRILPRVVDRNKKGQMKLSERIKVPANVFPKICSPMKRPNSRKNSVLIRPRIIQDSMVFFIAVKIKS